MSLIVTFNGQFKPYQPSVGNKEKVNKLKGLGPDFNDLIDHYLDKESSSSLGAHSKLNKSKISSYEKNQNIKKRKVYARDIMSTKIKILSPKHSIADGLNLIAKNQIHHIPILENDILVGVVSDRLLLNVLEENKPRTTFLRDIMTKKILLGQEHSSISEIARVMLEEKVNCIPITTKELSLKGLVTSSDILELLVHSFPLEIYA
jgi:CBS domain-containing protein